MLMNKMLQKFDKSPDFFKHYACDMNRRKIPCFCKNKDSVKKVYKLL